MSGHSKWENIKRKKGKTDAIRAKITTKISKEITIAARMGGGDPVGNMRLKLALTKAKQNNVPKENIQRAIAKGVGAASGVGFDEVTYEGYGPGGAAVIAECNTDNRNRMAADIRHAFTHHGGSLGATGCVAWMFKKKGSIIVDKEAADEDTIMMIALGRGRRSRRRRQLRDHHLAGRLHDRLRRARQRRHCRFRFRSGHGAGYHRIPHRRRGENDAASH